MLTQLKNYWNLLVVHLRPERRRVIVLAVLLLASIALQLINPQILRYFIDAAQGQANTNTLLLAACLFIAIALVTQLLSVGASYVSENVAWSATNQLRSDLTMHCLRLDMTFHKARTPGELIERIDGDVTALANFFSQFVILIVGNVILMIGVLIVLTIEDWRIGAVMVVLATALFVVLLKVQQMAVPYWTKARESSAALFGFIEERLSGTEDIRSSGAIDYTMNRFYERSRSRLRTERRAAVVGAATWITPIVFFALATALMFWLGFTFYTAGTMTLGTIYLVFFYTEALLRPVIQITRQIEDLQKAGAGVVRIQELYQITSGLTDGERVFPAGPLAVAFDQVSFGYNDDPSDDRRSADDALETTDDLDMVLNNITFGIQAGRTLGILGRTGSGKTTLTRLLFRLYDVTGGAIRLGGMDIREAMLTHLRQRVGMVTQDVQLFHATVRDNLTFFDSSISDERILAVLEDLELMGWYRALPHGLDTMLAAGSGGLSAGEAQVLAFTRVFLRDPGLIILDEASSRLDPATERLIERAVDKLLHNRTGIIIAHRLATVLRADDILILEDGEIREYGETERLRHDSSSRFSQLLRAGMEEVLV